MRVPRLHGLTSTPESCVQSVSRHCFAIKAQKRTATVKNTQQQDCTGSRQTSEWSRAGLSSLGLLGVISTAPSLAAVVPPDVYVPGPVQVGPEIWVGVIASCIPFAIGSWEFAKRIIIQRRCQTCSGSGLVMRGRFARKCPECGGFFPWQGWRRFFTSTAAPGNGGPLRQPRGQTSIFYKVPKVLQKGTESLGSAEEGGVQNNGTEEAVSSSKRGGL